MAIKHLQNPNFSFHGRPGVEKGWLIVVELLHADCQRETAVCELLSRLPQQQSRPQKLPVSHCKRAF